MSENNNTNESTSSAADSSASASPSTSSAADSSANTSPSISPSKSANSSTASSKSASPSADSSKSADKKTNTKRDSFRSRRGFIIACIGSAVGMGNIWLFPTRVSAYGGGTFIIPYLIFVLLIASTGVIEEMAFGRAMRKGPIGAFGKACATRSKSSESKGAEKLGKSLGAIPVLVSLAMAIGYSVVVGWICKYTFDVFTGNFATLQGAQDFATQFGAVAESNILWQCIGLAITVLILIFGIGKGIEKANNVMMPLFFLMFVGLAIYVVFLPGSAEGYSYIFRLDIAGLADPYVWVFALGQAFFSLSVAGSGTLIYGSYLKNDADVPNSAKYVAIFDTLAAILASLVIIPAMASAGQQLSQGGPGLLFIYLPNLFSQMPGGTIFQIIFFVAVLFGGVTSLINLYEAPIATVQEFFHLPRKASCIIIGVFGLLVSLLISSIVSEWMDFFSVYMCPIGACLAAIMFFWVMKKDWVLEQVNLGRKKPLGAWFYPLAKYGFVFATIAVLVLGTILGGIG